MSVSSLHEYDQESQDTGCVFFFFFSLLYLRRRVASTVEERMLRVHRPAERRVERVHRGPLGVHAAA
jgi:hypothetical protein